MKNQPVLLQQTATFFNKVYNIRKSKLVQRVAKIPNHRYPRRHHKLEHTKNWQVQIYKKKLLRSVVQDEQRRTREQSTIRK